MNVGLDGDGPRYMLIEITGLWTFQQADFSGMSDNLTLLGGVGYDTLVGQRGADTLSGAGQADKLYGEDGDDVLIGGAAADRLEGGAGSDRFVYRAKTDSLSSARDIIADFTQGDRIDLSELDGNATLAGRQGFTFLGEVSTAAASSLGAGSVSFHQYGGSTFVNIGVDSDGQRDLLIEVIGLRTFSSGDFMLG
ncbi:M10 family metallopeptidase C-terminal domain-containing protein [Falsiroseomonas sp.]|uniref:M10 family metallopeptidase C-terminal domain-containing protein n=1 Tax=Falsiroseomonas sp. TaxID=2870721 RepID=UPI003F718103